MFDHSLLTGCYTVTFLIAVVLPGWRSVAGAAAAAALLLALYWSQIGGRAGWLEMILLATGFVGLSSGIAARALSLWIAPYARRPVRALLIVATCYLVAPMLWAGPAASWQWLSRTVLPSPG